MKNTKKCRTGMNRYHSPLFFRLGMILGVLAWCSALYGQEASIQKAIEEWVQDPAMKSAGLGLCVIDVESGETVASYQPQLSLVPASALKVVSTSTALAILGPGYRFKTELQYDGTIGARGVLDGNLYLTGSGDPTLGSDQLETTPDLEEISERFRLAVQQKGIRMIQGYIVGDGSCFESAVNAPNWYWTDLGNYYASGAWGLNIHENLYYLHFQQITTLGASPRIATIEPEIPGLEFYNEVTTAERGSGDNAYIFGAPYTYLRFVRGTIPAGSGRFTIKGAIPDPPLFASQYFRNDLESVGIVSTKGPVSFFELAQNQKTGAKRTTLYTHYSPSLTTLVKRALEKSVNLYCESLLKTIGKEKSGNGSREAGLEAIQQYWTAKGLAFDGAFLEDASGLSTRNAVPAQFLARFLALAAREKQWFPVFYEAMPAAGHTGPLQFPFKGTAAEGKLRAKSGTMERVRTFCGYAVNKNGRLLAFAFLVNNYTGPGNAVRQKLERLMIRLCQ